MEDQVNSKSYLCEQSSGKVSAVTQILINNMIHQFIFGTIFFTHLLKIQTVMDGWKTMNRFIELIKDCHIILVAGTSSR